MSTTAAWVLIALSMHGTPGFGPTFSHKADCERAANQINRQIIRSHGVGQMICSPIQTPKRK
jgi:hypothetical protein